MVKPAVAAVAGALISGAIMYTVGAKITQVDAFQTPELVQTVDGGFVPASRVSYTNAVRPASAPVRTSTPRVTPTRTVYRTATPERLEERVVVSEDIAPRDTRSWQKTAMVIGGSAASGAGVGGIVKGKKGALIGAAIGGGAASIYEATRRR